MEVNSTAKGIRSQWAVTKRPLNLDFTIFFFLFTLNFTDIDECASVPSACDVNAACSNSEGSYSCECKRGFTGNGTICEGSLSVHFAKIRPRSCSLLNSCAKIYFFQRALIVLRINDINVIFATFSTTYFLRRELGAHIIKFDTFTFSILDCKLGHRLYRNYCFKTWLFNTFLAQKYRYRRVLIGCHTL